MIGCFWRLLISVAVISNGLLSPVLLLGGLALHSVTVLSLGVAGLRRWTEGLNVGIAVVGVASLLMLAEAIREWRHLYPGQRPKFTWARSVAALLGLFLFLYALAWLPVWAQRGSLTPLAADFSAVRFSSALAISIGVLAGWLTIELIRWWKPGGGGDLWEDKALAVYIPENGPAYYEKNVLFGAEGPLMELPDQLLSIGLDWFWTSSREPGHDLYNNPELPDKRPITKLTPLNANLLLADLRERDIDWDGREVTLIGTEHDAGESLLDADTREDICKEFSQRAEGPIRILIFQEYDGRSQLVFVPSAPTEPVRTLLAAWGITSDAVKYVRRRRGEPLGERLLATSFGV